MTEENLPDAELRELARVAAEEAALEPNVTVHLIGDAIPQQTAFRLEYARTATLIRHVEGDWSASVLFENDGIDQTVGNPDHARRPDRSSALDVVRYVLRQAARESLISPAAKTRFDLGTLDLEIDTSLVANADHLFPQAMGGKVEIMLDDMLARLEGMRTSGQIVGHVARTREAEELLDAIRAAAVIALSKGITRWPRTTA